MGHPVVHFEVMGTDAAKLQKYYADLFGWKINVFPGSPVNYGLVEGAGIGVIGLFNDPGGNTVGVTQTAS
jgi:predicted enzyme related to lactoylglutathione lyase